MLPSIVRHVPLARDGEGLGARVVLPRQRTGLAACGVLRLHVGGAHHDREKGDQSCSNPLSHDCVMYKMKIKSRATRAR